MSSWALDRGWAKRKAARNKTINISEGVWKFYKEMGSRSGICAGEVIEITLLKMMDKKIKNTKREKINDE